MDDPAFHHLPVLLDDVVELLRPGPGRFLVDGTVGGGGHAEALLEHGVELLGLDRDPAALAAAGARLARFGDRVRLVHAPFSALPRVLGDRRPDGVLLDLGVSSPQLDRPERGFSFRADGPLDMRQDPTSGQPLSVWLDELDEAGLADVLFRYGEERRARAVARVILAGRPWSGTRALAEAVARVVGGPPQPHPATRTFQALRILVNDELGELDAALRDVPPRLAPGGRFVVIAFHSLEARAVKQAFAALAGEGAPRDVYGNPLVPPRFRRVERRARKGDADANPRARSATLRALEALP